MDLEVPLKGVSLHIYQRYNCYSIWVLTNHLIPFYSLRGVWEEYVSLRSFINAEIAQRKFLIRDAIEHDIHGGDYDSVKKDVFSRLVLASETDGKYGMSDIELVSVPSLLQYSFGLWITN